MNIYDLLIGILLLLLSFLILAFAINQSKKIGHRYGNVIGIFVGGIGLLVLSIIYIIKELSKIF